MHSFNQIILFSLFGLLKETYCLFQIRKKLTSPFVVLKGRYGLKQCVKECLLQHQCQAIGYYTKHLRCELSCTENVVDILDSASLTAARQDLMQYQNLLGSCAYHSCAPGTKCVVKKSGLPECVTTAVCNNNNNYTLVRLEYCCLCQKIYHLGFFSVRYSQAASQCQQHGGRLMIMDDIQKINITAPHLIPKGWYIINGQKDENGVWKLSDGRDFVKFSDYSYSMNNGIYVKMNSAMKFGSLSESDEVYGYICEQ